MGEKIGLQAVLGTQDFDTGLKKYLGGIADMNKKTGKATLNLSKGFTALGGSMTKVGAVMTGAVAAGAAAAAAAITGIAVSSTKLAIGFEAQLDAVSAVLGATVTEMEQIEGLASELALSPTLKVSAVEAGQAIELLARNGLDATQILNGAAESTVTLANATGAEFGKAADIATDAMAAFNIEAEDMAEAVDGITSVTTASKFDIEAYRFALANAGGVAGAVGIEFEDFNATLAAISPRFAGGAQAGVSFKVFLQRLIPIGNRARDAMAELGLITEDGANAFFTAEGAMKSMSEVSALLSDATRDLTEEQRLQAFTAIFGSNAFNTAVGIAEQGVPAFNSAEDAMRELGIGFDEATKLVEEGATRFDVLQRSMAEVDAGELVKTRIDNVAGALEIMKSVVDGVSIQIGKAFLPAVRDITEAITEFVSRNQEKFVTFFQSIAEFVGKAVKRIIDFVVPLVETFLNMEPVMQRVVLAFVTFGAALGPIILAFGLLFTAIGALIPLITTIGTAISAIALPALLSVAGAVLGIGAAVGVAVAGLAALAAGIATNFGGLRDAVVGLVQGTILPIFRSIADRGRAAFQGFVAVFRQFVLPVLKEVARFISGVFIPLIGVQLKNAFRIAETIADSFSRRFKESVLPSLRRLGEAIKVLAPRFVTLGKLLGRIAAVASDFATRILGPLIAKIFDANAGFNSWGIIIDYVTGIVVTLAAGLELVIWWMEAWVKKAQAMVEVAVLVGQAIGLIDEAAEGSAAGIEHSAEALAQMAQAEADLATDMEELTDLHGDMTYASEESAEASEGVADSWEELTGQSGELEDGLEGVSDAFAEYFEAALDAELETISLAEALFQGGKEADLMGKDMLELSENSNLFSDSQKEAAALLAEVQVETDRLTGLIKEGVITTGEANSELQHLFGTRVADVNAMLAQERAAAALAEVIGGAMTNAFQTVDGLLGDLGNAYVELGNAQEELTARPWDQDLIDQAANAQKNVEAKFQAIEQSYRQMVFEIIAASDGVFDELDAQLGVTLGIFTQTEADLRLQEADIQNTVQAFFGTIENPNVDVVAALQIGIESGEVDGSSVDRMLSIIRTATESGFGDVVEATINASIALAAEDGVIDTSDIENIFRSVDLASFAGGDLDATISANAAVILDDEGIAALGSTIQNVQDTVTGEMQQQRVIDEVVEVALSGNVDVTELAGSIDQVLALVAEEGLSFNEALDVLVKAEADTAAADAALAATGTLKDNLSGETVITATADAEAAMTPLTNLKGLLDEVNSVEVVPVVASGVETGLAALNELDTDVVVSFSDEASIPILAFDETTTTTLTGLQTNTELAMTNVSTSVTNTMTTMTAEVSTSLDGLVANFTASFGQLSGIVGASMGNVVGILAGFNAAFFGAGLNYSTSLASGMMEGSGEVAAAATAIVEAAIAAANAAAGAQSPATTMITLGRNMDEGLAVGVKENAKLVTNAMTGMVQDVIDVANNTAESGQMSQIRADLAKGIMPGKQKINVGTGVSEGSNSLPPAAQSAAVPKVIVQTTENVDNSKSVYVDADYATSQSPDTVSDEVNRSLSRIR